MSIVNPNYFTLTPGKSYSSDYIIQVFNEALQKILALFSVGLPQAGVYVLMIPDGTTGGNDAVKSALSSATNKPPDSLDFCVGMMMMGGSASIKPLMTLLAAGSK